MRNFQKKWKIHILGSCRKKSEFSSSRFPQEKFKVLCSWVARLKKIRRKFRIFKFAEFSKKLKILHFRDQMRKCRVLEDFRKKNSVKKFFLRKVSELRVLGTPIILLR